MLIKKEIIANEENFEHNDCLKQIMNVIFLFRKITNNLFKEITKFLIQKTKSIIINNKYKKE